MMSLNYIDFDSLYSLLPSDQCPEKEPSLSLYLRVCNPCRQQLEDRQVAQYRLCTQHDDSVGIPIWEQIVQVHTDLQTVQDKIDEHLPKVSAGLCFLSI